MSKASYVLGFAFNSSGSHVVLIHKKRPEWQAGKWNGVGGHVEPGESSFQAMTREFLEETAMATSINEWVLRGTMQSLGQWNCDVFTTTLSDLRLSTMLTMTDEAVELVDLRFVRMLPKSFMENVAALIELCVMLPGPPSNRVPIFNLDYV